MSPLADYSCFCLIQNIYKVCFFITDGEKDRLKKFASHRLIQLVEIRLQIPLLHGTNALHYFVETKNFAIIKITIISNQR